MIETHRDGFSELSDSVAYAFRCPASPRHRLLAESSEKPPFRSPMGLYHRDLVLACANRCDRKRGKASMSDVEAYSQVEIVAATRIALPSIENGKSTLSLP
jgi:hypothetical protein